MTRKQSLDDSIDGLSSASFYATSRRPSIRLMTVVAMTSLAHHRLPSSYVIAAKAACQSKLQRETDVHVVLIIDYVIDLCVLALVVRTVQ